MSETEVRVERDRNVLTGEDLARIRFRRPADRHWRSVLVVLDEETDFETVETNALLIVATYAGDTADPPSEEEAHG